MKVFVVMGNDFPDSVFADSDAADAYIWTKMSQDRKDTTPRTRIHWRWYEFEVKS